MKTPVQLAEEIVAREGGFVNDPNDPGGATNHGVTLGTLQRLGLDLDGDGRVGVADVKRLTPEQARDIFLKVYFRAPGIDRLPEALQPSVFDMYVNSGRNAVRILQSLFNGMGADLQVDGSLGPQTLSFAARACGRQAGLVADAYGIARRNYYYALADKRPASRRYARRRDGGKGGWIVRAEEFISPRYHLSDAAHRARTAAWG
ncbi:holin-associated N-acetylmuramidase [Frigidibacter sp. MR17.14]|uniref:holin-associated N-acetylmuramidase n=1 Tax=Frigidibacter sp. MR17.14 TaxID=3126509 RepID=UPI0030130958